MRTNNLPEHVAHRLDLNGQRLTLLGKQLQQLAAGRGVPGNPVRQLDALRNRVDGIATDLGGAAHDLGGAAHDLDIHRHADAGFADLQQFLTGNHWVHVRSHYMPHHADRVCCKHDSDRALFNNVQCDYDDTKRDDDDNASGDHASGDHEHHDDACGNNHGYVDTVRDRNDAGTD